MLQQSIKSSGEQRISIKRGKGLLYVIFVGVIVLMITSKLCERNVHFSGSLKELEISFDITKSK